MNSHASPADEFFAKVVDQQLGAENLFRITITSFLDAYNFDVRRVMKCCTHHVLPSGHVIPFCAYNVLYRDGHVPLPTLMRFASNQTDLPQVRTAPQVRTVPSAAVPASVP